MSSSALISFYYDNVARLALRYESPDPPEVNHWLIPYLPKKPALILDIGAGTGRDAGWLASLGHEVVAVEPAQRMRVYAQKQHGSDRIPGLMIVCPA
jgi:SAM-dependent methyltransferase